MKEQYKAQLDELVTALELSNEVRQITSAICHQVIAQDLHHRYTAETTVASSLYVAARHIGISIDLGEITDVTQLDRTSLERTYTRLAEELGSDLDLDSPHPRKLVARFCSELNVDEPTETAAYRIVDDFSEAELHAGCHPSGVAAGAVYLAARLNDEEKTLTQEEVIDATGVSLTTLRQRYQEQGEALELTENYGRSARPTVTRRLYRILSASELSERLDNFDVLKKNNKSLHDTRVRCVHCGATGEYSDLRHDHSSYICGEQ